MTCAFLRIRFGSTWLNPKGMERKAKDAARSEAGTGQRPRNLYGDAGCMNRDGRVNKLIILSRTLEADVEIRNGGLHSPQVSYMPSNAE